MIRKPPKPTPNPPSHNKSKNMKTHVPCYEQSIRSSNKALTNSVVRFRRRSISRLSLKERRNMSPQRRTSVSPCRPIQTKQKDVYTPDDKMKVLPVDAVLGDKVRCNRSGNGDRIKLLPSRRNISPCRIVKMNPDDKPRGSQRSAPTEGQRLSRFSMSNETNNKPMYRSRSVSPFRVIKIQPNDIIEDKTVMWTEKRNITRALHHRQQKINLPETVFASFKTELNDVPLGAKLYSSTASSVHSFDSLKKMLKIESTHMLPTVSLSPINDVNKTYCDILTRYHTLLENAIEGKQSHMNVDRSTLLTHFIDELNLFLIRILPSVRPSPDLERIDASTSCHNDVESDISNTCREAELKLKACKYIMSEMKLKDSEVKDMLVTVHNICAIKPTPTVSTDMPKKGQTIHVTAAAPKTPILHTNSKDVHTTNETTDAYTLKKSQKSQQIHCCHQNRRDNKANVNISHRKQIKKEDTFGLEAEQTGDLFVKDYKHNTQKSNMNSDNSIEVSHSEFETLPRDVALPRTNEVQYISSDSGIKDLSSESEAKDPSYNKEVKHMSTYNEVENMSSDDDVRDMSSGKEVRDMSSGKETKDRSSGKEIIDMSSGKEVRDRSSGKEVKDRSSGKETKDRSYGKEVRDMSSGKETKDRSSGKEVIDMSSSKDNGDMPSDVEVKDMPVDNDNDTSLSDTLKYALSDGGPQRITTVKAMPSDTVFKTSPRTAIIHNESSLSDKLKGILSDTGAQRCPYASGETMVYTAKVNTVSPGTQCKGALTKRQRECVSFDNGFYGDFKIKVNKPELFIKDRSSLTKNIGFKDGKPVSVKHTSTSIGVEDRSPTVTHVKGKETSTNIRVEYTTPIVNNIRTKSIASDFGGRDGSSDFKNNDMSADNGVTKNKSYEHTVEDVRIITTLPDIKHSDTSLGMGDSCISRDIQLKIGCLNSKDKGIMPSESVVKNPSPNNDSQYNSSASETSPTLITVVARVTQPKNSNDSDIARTNTPFANSKENTPHECSPENTSCDNDRENTSCDVSRESSPNTNLDWEHEVKLVPCEYYVNNEMPYDFDGKMSQACAMKRVKGIPSEVRELADKKKQKSASKCGGSEHVSDIAICNWLTELRLGSSPRGKKKAG